MSVIFFPVAFRTRWWHAGDGCREAFRRTLPLGALAVLFLAFYASLGPPAAYREGSFTPEGGWPALLLGLECLGTYIRLLCWPFSLTADYIGLETAPRDLVSVGLGVLALAVLCLIFVRLRRFLAPGRAMGRFVFAFACLALTLLPVSNLIPIKALLAERYLYFGSLPVLLWIGAWLAKRAPRASACALVLVLAVLSAARTLEWRAEKPLWGSCVRSLPWAWRAGLNLCNAHAEDSSLPATVRTRRALAAADLGLRANPAASELWHEKGYVLLLAGRPGDALPPLRKAHSLAPRDPQTRFLLIRSLALLASVQPAEARKALRDLLQADPSMQNEAVRDPVLREILLR